MPTDCMLVIPKTKHIASSILDFPDPLRPVIALKDSSKPENHQLDIQQQQRA